MGSLRIVSQGDVPRLDLDAYRSGNSRARRAVVATAKRSLERFNFLAVDDDGLNAATRARIDEASRALFALPAEQKRACAAGPRGHMPYGIERALRGRRPDLKELWHLGRSAPADTPRALRSFYEPDNPWPPGFDPHRAVLEAAFRRFERCADTIAQILAETLELPAGTFADLARGGAHTLRLIRYPALSGPIDAGQARAVEHTGAGLFGVLPPATAPGLEVCTRDGQWQALRGFDEAMVVTVADMMERLTDLAIPGSLHRVATPDEAKRADRYAVVFFANARPDVLLAPPAALVRGRPRLRPVRADAFLRERMTEVWLPGASPAFRAYWRVRQRIARRLGLGADHKSHEADL